MLRALALEHCPLDEFTQERYAEVRARNPQIGLPRDTTIERACGSWYAALEQAGMLVSAEPRLSASGR